MLNFLVNMFMGRRRTGLAGFFDRSRRGGAVNAVNNHRGASALGAIASVAAPFVIRKLLDRRSMRQHAA
jgi:hypothetical protein